MAPYNPMKKHMDKIDEWGSAQSKKFNAQRDAGSGTSISDRFNMARGRDTRWDNSKASTAAPENEDPHNIVPARTSRAAHLPPAPPSTFNRSARTGAPPPPPPQRNGSGAPPPPPTSARPAAATAPPPTLPRRMDNENGIPNPPPPYPASNAPPPPARRQASATEEQASLEFSKFGPEDKEAFFEMLDEYFAARMNVTGKSSLASASKASSSSSTNTSSSILAVGKAAAPPVTITNKHQAAPKPSGPGAKTSISAEQNRTAAAAKPSARAPSSSTWTYPRLTASAHPCDELCKALTCSSFFAYRESFPEWSGAHPWFTKSNAIPSTLQGRRDIAWSSSSMYRGDEHTLMGATLFDDLSCLWWRVSWNKTQPAATVRADAAYREPPPAWTDEGRLFEAARGFGDWIAGFAEQSEQSRQPVGDGECWTLAAEAIKYTNTTAQLTADNRLLTSIGRTHGHLIYAAKADPVKGQCGRWRGGDRIREHWGGIRRGDIIEWRSARCSELNGVPGSYVTLGAPEHTAVIIDNVPLPEWVGNVKSDKESVTSESLYRVLGVKPSATQAEIRSAYLAAARRHHPDRHAGGGGVLHDDERIQRLNEANEILSDPSRRATYDASLQDNAAGSAQSNATRISSTVDLDDMDVTENGDKLTFYHACRCGSGYYVGEDELQNVSRVVVQCSGCSERLRIVTGQDGTGVDPTDTPSGAADDDRDNQPCVQPWELGSVTTIEQSAGQVPTRRTYSLARDSFTQGELWIYRPVWEKELLGGAVQPGWPPSLNGWQSIA